MDECDASVPAHWGIYDNANLAYRNTAYFPVFQAQLMKKLLDLDELRLARVAAAATWSWYLEGDRFFEGTRSLFTADNLATPLLNVYRMFALLPEQRLAVVSSRGSGLSQLEESEASPEVDALAATDGKTRIVAIIWHHCDDQYRREEAVPVTVTLRDLPFAGRRVRMRHFRIDDRHSNSYTAWVAAGRSQDPGPAELATLHEKSGLKRYAEDEVIEHATSQISVEVSLPLPGVSLLELQAIEEAG